MIDTLELLEELKETFEPLQAERLARLLARIYKDIANTVTKEEFKELTEVVKKLGERIDRLAEAQEKTEQRLNELAEAQRKTEESLESFKKATEENFNRVWKTINELAEAQRRTEERVNELAEAQRRTEQRVNELAEAQRRTEQRVNELAEEKITEERLNELAEAQKRTEERLNELAEAQKKTEQRLNELAEAQKKTEESLESFKKATEENFNRVWKAINELAEAQKKTEESLNKLIKRVDLIEKRLEVVEERLEGVSNSVGYSLENSAYKALPSLLKKEGIEVSGRLIRRYWQENQINIWGKGRQKGKEILILGEAKVRPSKKEIERFLRIAEEIKRKEKKEAYLLFVAHDFPPAIEELLQKKGIKYYWSYEF
jgi:ABC-type transporter Mla subunit MlaD